MSEMQEAVTKSLLREFVEPKLTTTGQSLIVSLEALKEAGWTQIGFHFMDNEETTNDAELFGDTDA
jgi:hypothetical protein